MTDTPQTPLDRDHIYSLLQQAFAQSTGNLSDTADKILPLMEAINDAREGKPPNVKAVEKLTRELLHNLAVHSLFNRPLPAALEALYALVPYSSETTFYKFTSTITGIPPKTQEQRAAEAMEEAAQCRAREIARMQAEDATKTLNEPYMRKLQTIVHRVGQSFRGSEVYYEATDVQAIRALQGFLSVAREGRKGVETKYAVSVFTNAKQALENISSLNSGQVADAFRELATELANPEKVVATMRQRPKERTQVESLQRRQAPVAPPALKKPTVSKEELLEKLQAAKADVGDSNQRLLTPVNGLIAIIDGETASQGLVEERVRDLGRELNRHAQGGMLSQPLADLQAAAGNVNDAIFAITGKEVEKPQKAPTHDARVNSRLQNRGRRQGGHYHG